jgi:uncharacterized protein YlxP (DUF503 family)
MIVGVARIDIRLFDIRSLKQKRSLVKRVMQRIRSGFPLSVAEVGLQDLYQRSVIGVSICAENETIARSVFRNLERDLETSGYFEVITIDFDYLNYGEEVR